MLVHTHACIHAGENSRYDPYSIRKTPILEIFTVQQRLRVYNILVFLPFCYNILKLSCSLKLVIILCSLNIL